MGTEPSEPPGLYVHTPFCRSRCLYCDFYSTIDEIWADRWIDGVLAEARQHRDRWRAFDTLYVGGGTPSLLPPSGLERLFEGLRSILEITADAEVTLEVNPDDVVPDRARRWLAMGVNRVSVGVQSLDVPTLGFLGRRHTVEDAGNALHTLFQMGFIDVGIDLIFGVPGLARSDWMETLRQACEWSRIKHLSCYELTIEAGTELGRRAAAGRIPPLDVERSRDMFLACDEALGRRFEHYEVSNYARGSDGRWRSRHNRKYWRHVPYLGLGPSAHSLEARERRWNPRSLSRWAGALAQGLDPTEDREQLTTEQWYVEELMLGLRTSDGVATDLVRAVDPEGRRLELARGVGLLEILDERIRPTTRGMLMADGLPLMLMGQQGDGSLLFPRDPGARR